MEELHKLHTDREGGEQMWATWQMEGIGTGLAPYPCNIRSLISCLLVPLPQIGYTAVNLNVIF